MDGPKLGSFDRSLLKEEARRFRKIRRPHRVKVLARQATKAGGIDF
jgi:hypothetical protein